MTYLLIVGLLFWIVLMIWIDRAYETIENPSTDLFTSSKDVSVVVAFRNEAETITRLLCSLDAQQGIGSNTEVILVNDHSEDASLTLIEELRPKLSNLNITVMHSAEQGKKPALLLGIGQASNAWVFLTDADCQLGGSHLITMLSQATSAKRQVVFAPVKFQAQSLFERFQAFENANTQMTTLAFLSSGNPLMANGANILIHRDKLEAFKSAQRMEYPGGDDVFFAQSLQKQDYTFCYDARCTLDTEACPDMQSWFNQRLRWVSKSTGYKRASHWLFGAGFILFQALYVFTFGVWIAKGAGLNTFFLFIVVKWLIDYSVQRKWAVHFEASLRGYEHVLVSVVYPFYSVLLGFMSILPVRYEWKSRTWKTTSKPV